MKLRLDRRQILRIALGLWVGLLILQFHPVLAADSLAEAAVTSDVKSLTTGDLERANYDDWFMVLADLRWSAVQVAHSLALIMLVGGAVMVYLLLSKSVTRNFERADLGHYWLSVMTRHIYWSFFSGLVLINASLALNWWLNGFHGPSLGGAIRIVLGVIMSLTFVLMVIFPFGKLRIRLEESDWEGARRALVRCRWMILIFAICGIGLASITSLAIDPISFE